MIQANINISADTICSSTQQIELPDHSHFIISDIPLIEEPELRVIMPSIDALMCFSKINLKPNSCMSISIKEQDGEPVFMGGLYYFPDAEDIKLRTKTKLSKHHDLLKMLKKSYSLCSICKRDAQNVSLESLNLHHSDGTVEYINRCEVIVSDVDAYNINFNSETLNIGLPSLSE